MQKETSSSRHEADAVSLADTRPIVDLATSLLLMAQSASG